MQSLVWDSMEESTGRVRHASRSGSHANSSSFLFIRREIGFLSPDADVWLSSSFTTDLEKFE